MTRALTGLCLCAAMALADGGMVAPPDGEVVEYGQVAVIRHFGGMEELTIAAEFQASSGFAWIIPLPSRPEVDSAQTDVFRALWEHCYPVRRGGGLWCSSFAPLGRYEDEFGGDVEELESGLIGDWEWRLFRATEPDTLVAWLDSLGYALPADLGTALDHYVDQGWEYFVACRVREGTYWYYAANAGIKLTFSSDSAVYPLRISRVSSEESPVTLYVLAEHRQMFDGARLRFSGRVDENTFPGLEGLVERESQLTKLYRYYRRSEMNDITLRQAPDDRDFRDVEFYGWAGGPVPLFGLLAAVLVVRRRRRAPADRGSNGRPGSRA
jgi:hypothetical protein